MLSAYCQGKTALLVTKGYIDKVKVSSVSFWWLISTQMHISQPSYKTNVMSLKRHIAELLN